MAEERSFRVPEEILASQMEREDDFHISQWIEVLRRRLGLLVVVTAAVLGFYTVNYFITPKEYRATCVVQIERRTPGMASVENIINYDSWADAQSFYPTQYRLLQSRGFAERVVRNLRLQDDAFFNPQRNSLTGGGEGNPVSAFIDHGFNLAVRALQP